MLFMMATFVVAPALWGQELREMPKKSETKRILPPRTGFIPPSIDLSHLTGKRVPDIFKALQTPARWDWREQGIVTTVQDQGACGSCYAFASLANIESKLLIDGAGVFDFSENHAKECDWYESSCVGGNYFRMANLFSQVGTVLESCDPYVDSDVDCNATCPYIKTLLDWRIISGDNVPDTQILKDYIYTHGPVYTAFYAGDEADVEWSSEFNDYDGSYTLFYEAAEIIPTNHAVLIVGWDDNLAHQGGSGGWIVKNSWGTNWGGTCGYGTEDGYFTIAYGSAHIGKYSSYIYDWQDYNEQGEVLFYDEGGWSTNWGYGDLTAWGLCKFISGSDYSLTSVEFWTNDYTTDIDIFIYDDFDGSSLSNLITSKLNLSFEEAGYHSVELDTPPFFSSGDDIFVAIKFTNSTSTFPVAADKEGPYETGTTYISHSGANYSWTDLGAQVQDDIAIRARMSTLDDITLTSPNGGEDWEVGSDHAITWNSVGTIANVRIAYSQNNGGAWSEVAASTANDGSYDWTVPDTPSENCLVRVSDAADGDPSDVSDAVFTITRPNQAPVVDSSISDTILVVDGADFIRDINASPAVFTDPDDDELSYSANSSAPAIASAVLSGSVLTVSALTEGSAEITLTADDNRGGQAVTDFKVRAGVLNPPENLSATAEDNTVTVTWDPPSSTSFFTLENYCVYCSDESDPYADPLETQTISAQNTSFEHTDLTPGDEWYYTVTAIYNGDRESAPCEPIKILIVGVGDRLADIPTAFMLKQNYPNPFNPTTTVEFDIPQASHVSIIIYDILGHKVRTLIDQNYRPGSYTIVWNGRDDKGLSLTSGMYLMRMRAADFIKVTKMLLLE